MRIRRENGTEYCTNCAKDWKSANDYERLCENYFCPDTYLNAVDDLLYYSRDVIKDLKPVIDEMLTRSVPPMTWEQVCENQPRAKTLFGVKG